MQSWFTWPLPFFIFFVFFSVEAAAAEETVTRLTLREAVDLSRQRDFEIINAQSGVESTRAGRITAGLFPNPQLSVNDTFINPSAPRVGSQITARVDQPFETFGKRRHRIDSAEHATRSSEYHLADVVRQRTLEVKNAFYHILLAQEHLRLARDNAERFRDILRINTLRLIREISPKPN